MENNKFFLKYDAWIGGLAFLLAVFFTHAPFFLYIPVPGISMDTFQYFWFAKQIFEGAIPVIKQPVEVPWGYPFFIYTTKLLKLNILQIVFVQTIIFLFAGSWTVFRFSKYIRYGGIFSAVALILFVFQPHTIRHNITLYTESLYTSALILICGSLVSYLFSKRLSTFSFLVFSIWCAMLIRPNGILLLSIPLFFILQAIHKGEKTLNYVLIFASVLLLEIVGNYYFKGKYSIGDSDRITNVINNLLNKYSTKKAAKQEPPKTQKEVQMPDAKTPIEMFGKYFQNFIAPKPSFYYSLEATNYKNLILQNMPGDNSLRMFDSRVSVDSFCADLRSFIFEDYPKAKFESPEYASNIDYSLHKRKWMFAVHLSYELLSKSKFYFLVYILFGVTFIVAVYQYFIIAQRSTFQHLILLLAFIHLLSLFLLPFMHGRFQLRYIHVTEFIVFLNAMFGIYYYLGNRQFLQVKADNLKH